MKIRPEFAALLLCAGAAATLPAHAVVITFDGLTGGTFTPNGANMRRWFCM